MKISGTCHPTKWNETDYGKNEASKKATRVSAEFSFSGDIEGIADVEYLMFYKAFDPSDSHNAVAEYVGIFRINGKLKGREGTFAFTDRGTYKPGVARSTIEIISGSGTGELSTLSGKGSYEAGKEGSVWEMDITI
jgi:Protein of unknown function (DUF3224)